MKIIEINALSNGAHRNQVGFFTTIPQGWAVIPDGMTLPETFPFVDLSVENGVVTRMAARSSYYDMINAEKERTDVLERIGELKRMLSETDYKAIKYAEGFISEAEYAPVKAERQAWRDEINALEEKL